MAINKCIYMSLCLPSPLIAYCLSPIPPFPPYSPLIALPLPSPTPQRKYIYIIYIYIVCIFLVGAAGIYEFNYYAIPIGG